jgi:hypothetical protein
MNTPENNTKIERVVEAVESLTHAVVSNHTAPKGRRAATFNNVQDARGELREALAEFVKPVLRRVA